MSLDILCTRVSLESFVAWSMELYGFLGVWGLRHSLDCSGGFVKGMALVWVGGLEPLGVLVVPGKLGRVTYHSQNFRYETSTFSQMIKGTVFAQF